MNVLCRLAIAFVALTSLVSASHAASREKDLARCIDIQIDLMARHDFKYPEFEAQKVVYRCALWAAGDAMSFVETYTLVTTELIPIRRQEWLANWHARSP